ncbi:MAG: cupin domain-containing protein [Halobacteriota archaeon]
MGYRTVDPDALDPVADRPCDLRRLSDRGALEHVAVNRFRAEPGEQLPLTYHYHETQQEAFFVVSGTLSIETPEETHTVPAGQLFVADAESPHRAYNAADANGTVTVLALGAPPVDGDAVAYEP